MAWGEQFERQYRSGPDLYWSPHWKRVEEEDGAMRIGPWAARNRKAIWQASRGHSRLDTYG